MWWEDRPCLEPNAGGIDVGARARYVAVPPDRAEHPARVFPTFTEDLQAWVQWLKACGDCDHEVEKLVSGFTPRVDPQDQPLPPERKRRHRNAQKKRKKQGRSANGFDPRTEAYQRFGVDATHIPGLEMSVLPRFSEAGRDLSTKWPTAPHFASWLGLCPDHAISGGRVLWKGTRQIRNRAGQIFRLAA